MARQANNKQNGRGKYQHTGPFSFCLTSQRHVLDRAQPPTLQQGGSPMFIVLLGWTLAAILVSVQQCGSSVALSWSALSTGITIGQCPGAARGVWPTVRLGMLEAASPRGCRENLCQGAVQETLWLLLASDLTALASDLTALDADFATRPARYRIASNHLPASRGHLAKAPGAIRRQVPRLENTCDLACVEPAEIRFAVLKRPSHAVKHCLAARRSRHTTHSGARWRSAACARQHLRLPIGERHV